MSEVIENTILGLIKNNCNVRAWEKAEGMVLSVRKNNFEKWFLINGNKILASC